MERLRIPALACLGAIAISAVLPSGAVAKKTPVTLSLEVGGVPLASGAEYVGSSPNFEVNSRDWNLSCSNSALIGTIGLNGQKKADELPIAEATFAGEPLCESTFEFVVFYNPTGPTTLYFKANGQAEVRQPRIRLVPREDLEAKEGKHEACELENAKMRGTFPVSEVPQPLVVTIAEPKFRVGPNAGKECGASPRPNATGTFTFTSEGQPIEVVK